MLSLERRNLILSRLQEDKKVIVSQLSQEFDVSEETIRRDLDKLDKEGIAVKIYGGAVLNENDNIELPFNVRKKSNVNGKQKMAELIADMVEDGEHIMLDASTSAVYIAKALKQKKNLTVVTNSIEIMIELSDVVGWNVICTGGNLKSGYLALVGPRADEGYRNCHVEKAFISCKSIHMDKGAMDGNDDLSQTKREMISAAQKCIFVVDSSKFGRYAFSRVCDFEDIDVVVTDVKPDADWLKLFEEMDVQCLYPEE